MFNFTVQTVLEDGLTPSPGLRESGKLIMIKWMAYCYLNLLFYIFYKSWTLHLSLSLLNRTVHYLQMLINATHPHPALWLLKVGSKVLIYLFDCHNTLLLHYFLQLCRLWSQAWSRYVKLPLFTKCLSIHMLPLQKNYQKREQKVHHTSFVSTWPSTTQCDSYFFLTYRLSPRTNIYHPKEET